MIKGTRYTQKKKRCKHCSKSFGQSAYTRFHGAKCSKAPANITFADKEKQSRTTKSKKARLIKKKATQPQHEYVSSEKVELVLNALIVVLQKGGLLDETQTADALELMLSALIGSVDELAAFTRTIHIQNLLEVFKVTQNASISKQISDLMGFESTLEDLEVSLITFGALPHWENK